jgi:hypothetical protein
MAKRARWMDGLTPAQVNFLLGLEPKVAICRGRRRHMFWGLVPGEPIPDTITISKPGGQFLIHEDCAAGCGRFIEYDAPGGVPDYASRRYGGWDLGKELAEKGLGLPAGKPAEYMAWIQRELVIEGYKLRRAQRQRGAAA